MNATGKIMLCGAAAVAVTLMGDLSRAATFSGWWSALHATAAQVSAPAPAVEKTTRPVTRGDVEALLLQAKQAIDKGDLQQAESLVVQAEAAGVRYPLFYSGDTPSRLRRTLDQAKRQAPNNVDPFLAAAAAKPGQFVADPSAAPRPLPAVTGDAPSEPNLFAEPTATPKDQAAQLIAAARAAMQLGDLDQAEQFASRAGQLDVPESEFSEADSPARLAWEIQQARSRISRRVMPATAVEPVGDPRYSQRALHVPETDETDNTPATALSEKPAGPRFAQLTPIDGAPPRLQPRQLPASLTDESASDLMTKGEEALRAGDLTSAWRQFQLANERRGELDAVAQSRLDSHLKMLTTAPVEGSAEPLAPPQTTGSSMFESADEAQRVLVRQMSSDVGKRTLEARELRESDPKGALDLLRTMKEQVQKSQLVDEYRRQLNRRVDLAIADTEKYISDNRAQIELDEKNAAVLAEVERSRTMRQKLREKKAEMVDQFHRLRDEQRYAEAELVAKQLYEMMPDDEVAVVLWQHAKFLRREMMHRQHLAVKEEGNFRMLGDVDDASVVNVFDDAEMVFPSAKKWGDVSGRDALTQRSSRMTQRELEIERKLRTPVQVSFEDTPLSEVFETLSQMTGVNFHLDPRGLSQEGVSSDTPITLEINQEIMLKSALNLILEQLHLSYLIKDEVLKITSEQLRDGETYPVTYYVADLVTPIPNFIPSNNIGLQGMINDAYAALGLGVNSLGAPGPIASVSGERPGMGTPNRNILAQNMTGPQFGAGGGGTTSIPLGGGGPSPGGGANADFDSLIDLIISTVASETWAENGGGEAEIRPYVNNLSLVVSQTQAVHEEIADLLEQLRRLQDLQITIEVRFIRLNDSFFERIGLDFDVNINDKTTNNLDLLNDGTLDGTGLYETPRGSATVGLQQAIGNAAFPTFTADLDVPFRQSSFGVAVPQFGGFQPNDVASFGFAILSDIEAYFLINAAQGDSRTNILNAPKVTLFNGQTAFVADASQTPFVISVIPVVGEFAAAQQPVIVVLSEGTMMNIQAVVSDDRRYVRLTVVPFFSEIGDVDTFTFEGSTSTDTSSSATDDDDDGTNEAGAEAQSQVISGTTVQLPTFQFVSVSTTVSVPDGGTVLLGGIKRLNEGRNEAGVPLLSKLPYINRLFRNVGIGRETDSLMMMVTPRIIIQEEEELKLTGGN